MCPLKLDPAFAGVTCVGGISPIVRSRPHWGLPPHGHSRPVPPCGRGIQLCNAGILPANAAETALRRRATMVDHGMRCAQAHVAAQMTVVG